MFTKALNSMHNQYLILYNDFLKKELHNDIAMRSFLLIENDNNMKLLICNATKNKKERNREQE